MFPPYITYLAKTQADTAARIENKGRSYENAAFVGAAVGVAGAAVVGAAVGEAVVGEGVKFKTF
jgi:hypothetical protein